MQAVQVFLSTLPARGATGNSISLGPRVSYFYPRSPRGERLTNGDKIRSMSNISIHAPREGSDITGSRFSSSLTRFLSTLPARGATHFLLDDNPSLDEFLSTLPARGATTWSKDDYMRQLFLSTLPARGATHGPAAQTGGPAHFYPRSPRGERRPDTKMQTYWTQFLSTLPARGATSRHSLSVRS